ncbi:hypothetical protein K6U27_08810 [Vibrio fluvialis]|uniref:hypothetical protein n=1 Tax=Vibrio fluvialis TaxID=676 RepID=UPI001EEA2E4A|nr:hypothetical protein [Vibrio fluvialis]MCG6372779.1 hypothetical protein [Vibrio fluvialis]
MDSEVIETLPPEPVFVQVYFGQGESQLSMQWDSLGDKPNPGDEWVEMQNPKPLFGRHYASELGLWLPMAQENFETEVDRVDNERRDLYSQMVDPLLKEAMVKRLMSTDESLQDALVLEAQALAARQKIQDDHPWPSPPSNTE